MILKLFIIKYICEVFSFKVIHIRIYFTHYDNMLYKCNVIAMLYYVFIIQDTLLNIFLKLIFTLYLSHRKGLDT